MENGNMPIVESVKERMRSPRGAGNGQGPLGLGLLGGSPVVNLADVRERVAGFIAGRPREQRLGPVGAPAGESYGERIEAQRQREAAEGAARNWVYTDPTIP